MTVEARDSGGPAKTNTATTRLVIKCANNISSNFVHYHPPRHWHFHHCIMIVITVWRYRHYIILKAWRMWTTFHRSSRGKPTKASWHRTSAASETICRSVLKGLVQLFWSSFFYQKITPNQKDQNLIKFVLLQKMTPNDFLGGGGGPGQDGDSEQPRPLRDHQGSHHTSAIFSINAFYHGSILALSAQLQPFSSSSSSSGTAGKLREQVPYRRGEWRDLRCGAAEAAGGQIWEVPRWDRACHHSSGDDDDDDIDNDDDKGDHDDGDELKIPHHLKIVCQVGILEVRNI